MSAHAVSEDWKQAKKDSLTARATAVSEALDHLTDVEEMLEQDKRNPNDEDTLRSIRELAARLRTIQRDYESEAGRVG